MQLAWKLTFALLLGLIGAGTTSAQDARRAILDGNPEALKRGSLLFRARCSGCHGLDAKGVSGPDLTAVLAAGTTEDRFFRVVRTGQGTDMPRFGSDQTADSQVWEILAHLRSLSQAGASEPIRGNAENGARIFRTSCTGCHRVNGVGGALGPDLSRVGSMRSASALMAKVRDPNKSPVPGFRPVSVVLNDGRRIRGVVKNEDAFSIQILDVSERIQGLSKTGVREIVREPRSPMPAFGTDRLSDSDLRDLVSHLMTLRNNTPAS